MLLQLWGGLSVLDLSRKVAAGNGTRRQVNWSFPTKRPSFREEQIMRRKVKQLFAAGMALAVLATNLTPLSFAAEQPDAESAAVASAKVAKEILDDLIVANKEYWPELH